MKSKENQIKFNDILVKFSRKHQNNNNELTASTIDTPIGELLSIADQKSVYLLQVLQNDLVFSQVKKITDQTKSYLIEGRTKPINSLECELKDYFNGKLEEFTTPIQMFGTDFQIQVWNELRRIPFGKQISYTKLAENVKRPNPAVGAPIRAVGTANGANKILIVVPCHRIINKNAKLGGFSAGIERKQWLLDHEMKKS